MRVVDVDDFTSPTSIIDYLAELDLLLQADVEQLTAVVQSGCRSIRGESVPSECGRTKERRVDGVSESSLPSIHLPEIG